MRNSYLSLIFAFGFINLFGQKTELPNTAIGPEKGTLVIVGGGLRSEAIVNEFVALAGGWNAAIVVIPTAGGSDSFNENSGFVATLRKLGATNVTMLHTRDKKIADSDSFTKPLIAANGVWFQGGRQWRLVDSYKDTKTEKLIGEVLERGGVVGGSSAGASIQGSFLARGDTKNNQIMMGDHQEGFGYLKNTAIDQHVLARNRQFDMFEILKKHPQLLGIGLDEDTAIVVQGNEFRVIGENYVLMYDGTFYSREGFQLKKLPEDSKLFYFLREGDTYDLLNRKVKR